jgi:hypothetical protein
MFRVTRTGGPDEKITVAETVSVAIKQYPDDGNLD